MIDFLSKRKTTLKRLNFDEGSIAGEPNIFKHLNLVDQLEELEITIRDYERDISSTIPEISKLLNLKILRLYCPDYINPIDIQMSFINLFAPKNFKNLLQLTITGFHDHSGEVIKNIALGCPQLEFLNIMAPARLQRTYFLPENYGLISIAEMSNLTTLKLYNLKEVIPEVFITVFASNNLTNLKELDFFKCGQINKDVIEAIVKGCPNLETFGLKWYDETFGLTPISQLQFLKNLDLSGAKRVTSEDFVSLFSVEHPKFWNNLVKLDLTNCDQIDEQIIQKISLACKNLESLTMANFKKTSGLKAISHLNNLKELVLYGTHNLVPSEFIGIFGNKCHKKLTTLDLSYCNQINEKVIESVSLNCPSLESLYLNFYHGSKDIEDLGIQHLCQNSHNLKKLYLYGLDLITDQCLSEIKKLLPRLCLIDKSLEPLA